MNELDKTVIQANKTLPKIGLIKKLSKQTNLPPIVFAIGPVVILVIAIALDIFASACTTFVGVAYPLIRSIIALVTEDKNDDK